MSDDYPSVRTALFGDGTVANLFCAVKWVCWHVLHAILVTVGALAGVVLVAAMVLYNVLLAIGRRVGQYVPTREVSESTTARMHRVGGAAKTTPITRRIYNECPVDIKQNPRWYQRLVGVGKDVADRLEPPGTVYVCEQCGEDCEYNFEPDRCIVCYGTEFAKVREGEVEDRVAEIRDDDDPEVATDGGRQASTIVGDPQSDAETADASELAEDFGQDGVSFEPEIDPCPLCRAAPGEPCTDSHGNEYETYHSARWRQAGREA